MAELCDRLRDPAVLEACSSLGEAPVLAVELGADAERVDAGTRDRLAQLACPTVALDSGDGSMGGGGLRDRFDVVVGSKPELDQVVRAVERAPQASLALVQLLRHGEALSIHEGLVAESFAYSVLQSGPEFDAWRAARQPPRVREPDEGPAVVAFRDGDELRLTLNRPGKRNAFSVEMRDALVEALQVVVSDASLLDVVLTGAGAAFSSGGDLDEFGTFPDPATAHVVRSSRNPARLMSLCADRVRVHVHGACVGAGIELPAFSSHVVARSDAFFQLPEVQFGLVPGAGGTVSLPRRIGRQRTAWLALTAERIDAATALDWGLVDEVTD